jgi:hypothetical protein
MRTSRLVSSWCLVSLAGLGSWSTPSARAAEPAWVKGTLTGNGKTVELPYVYVYALEKGFYDDADPTWKVLFVQHEIEERKVDEHIWDSAYVELGITRTAEFGDKPELQVYSQSIRFSADSGGNISGGSYPKLELESAGPERFAGRVWLPEEQKVFDDTFQYDFRFSAPLSDPNAPIGEALPPDGGEPGKAYRAWVDAVHSGDLERLKKLVPAEMASQLDADDAKQNLEMMAAMTPTSVKVLGGSSDGKTAILQVDAVMDGETVRGEITLQKMDGFWMATRSSW